MSQGAIVVPDSDGTTFLANLNAALARLQSRGSGTARPSDIGAYELWVETDNPGAGIVSIWQYDGTSDVLWALLNTSAHSIAWYSGGALLATESYVDSAVANAGAFKNRLFNGDFAIDQRNEGAAQTLTAAAAVAYCVDRWYASCTGANVTVQRVAGTSPNRYALKFTGAASVTAVLLGQRIEVANIYDLVSGDVVVSGKVKSSSLTSLTWKAYYANAADDFSAKTQIATGTISGITSALAAFEFTFNAGASAGNGVAIEFEGGALLAAETLQFEILQLESGTTATAFERLAAGVRLLQCQRYYEKTYDIGTALAAATHTGLVGTWGANVNYYSWIPYMVPKRVAPTMATWDGAGNASKSSYYSSGWTDNQTVMTPVEIGTRGYKAANPGGGTTLNMHHYTASAEL